MTEYRTIGFILLEGLKLSNVNAEANFYVFGFPAVTGFTGFGHWLELKLNEELTNKFRVEGVGIISHSFSMHAGRPKCPTQLEGLFEKSKSSKNRPKCPTQLEGEKYKANPPIVDEAKADLSVSLVLRTTVVEASRFRPGMPNHFSEFEKVWLKSNKLKSLINASVICGGGVSNFKDVKYFLEKELVESLKRIKGGYFLRDRIDLLENRNGKNPLDLIFEYLTAFRNKEDPNHFKRKQGGWIVPLAVGYQGIETPKKRTGVRKGYEHMYAEPLVGLGEFVHIKKFLYQESFNFDNFFWQHFFQPEYNIYYVSTKIGGSDDENT